MEDAALAREKLLDNAKLRPSNALLRSQLEARGLRFQQNGMPRVRGRTRAASVDDSDATAPAPAGTIGSPEARPLLPTDG